MAQNRVAHRVEWGETDGAGIVFYPNYLRWFDQATHELFRSLDVSLQALLRDERAAPVVIEVNCRLLARVLYDDELEIQSRVAELRTRALRVAHEVHRGDQIVASGHEVRMWARLSDDGIEPLAIPDNVRALLGRD